MPAANGCSVGSRRHVEDGVPLLVDAEGAVEGAVVAGLLRVAGGGHQRDELVAQPREQRAQLGGGEAGLEVVEQRVVGVLEALEALDVPPAQLDVALEEVAEAAVVVGGARLLPGGLAERPRLRHRGGQLGRDADGLLVVAPRPVDEPGVV